MTVGRRGVWSRWDTWCAQGPFPSHCPSQQVPSPISRLHTMPHLMPSMQVSLTFPWSPSWMRHGPPDPSLPPVSHTLCLPPSPFFSTATGLNPVWSSVPPSSPVCPVLIVASPAQLLLPLHHGSSCLQALLLQTRLPKPQVGLSEGKGGAPERCCPAV